MCVPRGPIRSVLLLCAVVRVSVGRESRETDNGGGRDWTTTKTRGVMRRFELVLPALLLQKTITHGTSAHDPAVYYKRERRRGGQALPSSVTTIPAWLLFVHCEVSVLTCRERAQLAWEGGLLPRRSTPSSSNQRESPAELLFVASSCSSFLCSRQIP